jgi:hypothetical protein
MAEVTVVFLPFMYDITSFSLQFIKLSLIITVLTYTYDKFLILLSTYVIIY